MLCAIYRTMWRNEGSRNSTSNHGILPYGTDCHGMSRHVTAWHVTPPQLKSGQVAIRYVAQRHVTASHITARFPIARHITARHVSSRQYVSPPAAFGNSSKNLFYFLNLCYCTLVVKAYSAQNCCERNFTLREVLAAFVRLWLQANFWQHSCHFFFFRTKKPVKCGFTDRLKCKVMFCCIVCYSAYFF